MVIITKTYQNFDAYSRLISQLRDFPACRFIRVVWMRQYLYLSHASHGSDMIFFKLIASWHGSLDLPYHINMARASSTVLAHVPHLGILLRKRRFPISFLTPCCLIHSSQSLSSGPTISSRKQVTVINDDARVQWKDLSGREKVARTTRQTFNLGVILTGLLMTVGSIDQRI